MSENTELLLNGTKDDVTRDDVVSTVSRGFLLVDSTNAILDLGANIPQEEVRVMLTVLNQALQDAVTIIGLQNAVTGAEYVGATEVLAAAAQAHAASHA